MNELLSQSGGQVDAVFFCPHGPKDGCDCRKPMPGLLEEISVRFQTKLDSMKSYTTMLFHNYHDNKNFEQLLLYFEFFPIS